MGFIGANGKCQRYPAAGKEKWYEKQQIIFTKSA